ncbi:MAG: phosphoserine transaminase [Alphaproteobacteria bacterium]|jgi:phosphoserine aminotransferase|nr:phosphoserine transaminase [Alphaproteobacteria bacterium]MCB1551159.1 phosphoserine transaminase [Alphaproteobacteria bacterium]MCB9985385.1 phosphoserine transaminase [Micavibrio sp.]
MDKPNAKPQCPNFSSGPCAKRPGWNFDVLGSAFLGRSHRAAGGKAKLKEVIDRHRATLNIPEEYLVAIVPASDTGAVEMALWSMLGERGVDCLAWESFSSDWMSDVVSQLKIEDVREFKVDYGQIPDLSQIDTDRDVVFVWNGTTSGVRLPHTDWIKSDRKGLTICDATSAVFAYEMDWEKLDVITWSWQKVLGGEAAHGMLVLSPRAVSRLETFKPNRALPKIFRMTNKGKINEGLFRGETINTPSMLAVEDCLDALKWVDSLGGWKGTQERCIKNLSAIENWVAKTDWIEFLPETQDIRSRTSICLKITDPWFNAFDADTQTTMIKDMVKMLDKENVAYDIAAYAKAPAGLRIWGGATIESADLEKLCPWIEWAYLELKASRADASVT